MHSQIYTQPAILYYECICCIYTYKEAGTSAGFKVRVLHIPKCPPKNLGAAYGIFLSDTNPVNRGFAVPRTPPPPPPPSLPAHISCIKLS